MGPGGAMQISERRIDDVVIVDVSGKITLGDGGDAALKDKMRSLVQQGQKKLLLNLGDVSYVDSAGLGEIVQSYATVNKNGGTLKLLNITKRIKDLLSITKLLTVFETFDSEAEAVTSFSARV
jgi:anti-sigma B factor antagonist